MLAVDTSTLACLCAVLIVTVSSLLLPSVFTTRGCACTTLLVPRCIMVANHVGRVLCVQFIPPTQLHVQFGMTLPILTLASIFRSSATAPTGKQGSSTGIYLARPRVSLWATSRSYVRSRSSGHILTGRQSTVTPSKSSLCASQFWSQQVSYGMVLHATNPIPFRPYDSCQCYHADPNLVRQITVKDFNKFHDRIAPGLNRSLFTGPRMEAARSGMLIAR